MHQIFQDNGFVLKAPDEVASIKEERMRVLEQEEARSKVRREEKMKRWEEQQRKKAEAKEPTEAEKKAEQEKKDRELKEKIRARWADSVARRKAMDIDKSDSSRETTEL